MNRLAKKVVSGTLWFALGRRNFARLARFLTLESRLDAEQEIERDGELIVQRVVLEQARRAGKCCVFDVGANLGDWSLPLLRSAQRAGVSGLHVHAFEPSSGTRAILERRLEAAGFASQVTISPAALSDARETRTLYVVGDEAGVNSLYAQEEIPPAERVESVMTERLDVYCAAHGIESIELLKCDVEGHDMSVLEGARRLVEARAIGVIQFEYNFRWVYSRRFLKDAFDYLGRHRYRLGKVTPHGIEFYESWHFELETLRQSNYLACTEEWESRFPRIRWWNEPSVTPRPQ